MSLPQDKLSISRERAREREMWRVQQCFSTGQLLHNPASKQAGSSGGEADMIQSISTGCDPALWAPSNHCAVEPAVDSPALLLTHATTGGGRRG